MQEPPAKPAALPDPRNFGGDDGLKSAAVRFSFASARVDSGNRAETPQSATEQKSGRRAGHCCCSIQAAVSPSLLPLLSKESSISGTSGA
jgi:hypothetical protein